MVPVSTGPDDRRSSVNRREGSVSNVDSPGLLCTASVVGTETFVGTFCVPTKVVSFQNDLSWGPGVTGSPHGVLGCTGRSDETGNPLCRDRKCSRINVSDDPLSPGPEPTPTQDTPLFSTVLGGSTGSVLRLFVPLAHGNTLHTVPALPMPTPRGRHLRLYK